MKLVGLDHVQLAMPAGREAEARNFYGDLLGLSEIPKPALLAQRGGAWFEGNGVVVHLGVWDEFAPAPKAHPAFAVSELDALQEKLSAAGVEVKPDSSVPHVRRFYAADPFGNRIEFIQAGDGFAPEVTGRIFQISNSPGGVPKRAVYAAALTVDGLSGDWQEDRKHHGGPQRALCLYSLERIQALQAEGHPIFPGSTGENLTLSGLPWNRLEPGTVLRLGESARIQITSEATPCQTIAESFADGRSVRISHKLHPGWSRWYAAVLQGGHIQTGDMVTLLPKEGED